MGRGVLEGWQQDLRAGLYHQAAPLFGGEGLVWKSGVPPKTSCPGGVCGVQAAG